MSPTALALAGLAAGVLAFCAGLYIGILWARGRRREMQARYEALKRDFDSISAANIRMLHRHAPNVVSLTDKSMLQRFLDIYDEAKRCLHRALDRHNAQASVPVVISKDGANILQALTDLPPLSFSEDERKDAGLRSWLYRVLELEMERRMARASRQTQMKCSR